MKRLEGYLLTFEAIQAVRHELELADREGDNAKALDAHSRLMGLYASIDANGILTVMRGLAPANVVHVDFTKRKAA